MPLRGGCCVPGSFVVRRHNSFATERLPPMNAESAPIATVEQFKEALLALRDKGFPDTHLTMLRAQAKAKEGMITSTKLAEVAGYENYNAANLQYGTLGFNLGAFIDYTPPKRKNGTLMWWTVLSYSIDGNSEPETGHFQFVMRPELMLALQEMKWVRP